MAYHHEQRTFDRYPMGQELNALWDRAFPEQYSETMSVLLESALMLLSASTAEHFFKNAECVRIVFNHSPEYKTFTAYEVKESSANNDALIGTVIATAFAAKSSINIHEYFAIQAILELEQALLFLKVPENCFTSASPNEAAQIQSDNTQLSLVNATRLLSIAQELAHEHNNKTGSVKNIKNVITQNRSIAAQEAANKSHNPNNAIKRDFIQQYQLLNPKIPVAQFARVFLNKLPAESSNSKGKQRISKPETLTRAHTKFKKNGTTTLICQQLKKKYVVCAHSTFPSKNLSASMFPRIQTREYQCKPNYSIQLTPLNFSL